MKYIIIIAAVLAATTAVFFFIKSVSKPISSSEAESGIQKLLNKEVQKTKEVSGGLVLIDSKGFDFSATFTAETAGSVELNANRPFHTASVGKAFTATLTAILLEEGRLKLDDSINSYINPEATSGLFTIDNRDYSSEVTIRQLLNHTSGAADYFDDSTYDSNPIKKLVIDEPDRFWTPTDLLAFSKNHQKAVDKPGELFHYSDTGYILLGLVLESAAGRSFDELLHEKIFIPLEMNDSYLMFYSEPVNQKRPIAEVWLNGVEISGYKSLSIDWAGGGIITTAEDLALFMRALNNYEIISEPTLNEFYSFDHRYIKGIHYGLGFMEFHFGEYFPTLKSMPKMIGHMGVLGTQMLFDRETDTIYISNFGSTDYSAGSVRTMIKIISMAMRIEKRP